MLPLVAKAFGIVGVLCITYGIFVKKEVHQDIVFALGGLALLVYSIYLRDPIFIPLQIIFTLASLYKIYKIKRKKYSS